MFGECTDYTKVQPTSDAKKRIFYSSELSNIALERDHDRTGGRRADREPHRSVWLLRDGRNTPGFRPERIMGDRDGWRHSRWHGRALGCKKVPDGQVFVAANTFRIRDIDPNDPDILYSKNLFSAAQANGWWDPSQGKLDWLKTVSGGEYSHPYYSLARVWSLYSPDCPFRKFQPVCQ